MVSAYRHQYHIVMYIWWNEEYQAQTNNKNEFTKLLIVRIICFQLALTQ